MSRPEIILERLVTAGVLGHFDRYFVQTLRRLAPDAKTEALLGAAFARQAVTDGHVCADLKSLSSTAIELDGEGRQRIFLPELEDWLRALKQCSLVGDGGKATPLVLQENRLYLNRYWRYETEVVTDLGERARQEAKVFDEAALHEGLGRFLGAADENSLQRQAAAMAVRRLLAIISGGPGTGKTTIVASLLALLQEQARLSRTTPFRILLLAPTGKAAARLSEALQEKKRALAADDALAKALPQEAATIHRALGYQRRTPTTFRYNRKNPLAVEAVVVDEASMVDVALLAKLLEAVPRDARLILLGDKDQLASVEAGSIMGDIWSAAEKMKNMARTGKTLETPDLGQCVLHLERSYRFDASRGIGALSRAVNAGDGERTVALLAAESEPDIALHSLAGGFLRRQIIEGYRDYLLADNPVDALRLLGRFRLLCAHRRGGEGKESLNDFCQEILTAEGLISPVGSWYKGRPIMIAANSYSLGLFNGDIGVLWPASAEDSSLRAFFSQGPGNTLRSLPPARLPRHETAFTLTIHKSQGSEFDKVAIVLPREMSPILSRELLYTAISRARRQAVVFGSPEIVRQMVGRRVERASGLEERLLAHGGGSSPDVVC